MNGIQFPVSINTLQIQRPRLNVYYPTVTGLSNLNVQHRINNTIFNLVHKLISEQGYYQNPLADVSGWYEIKTNERGFLSLSLKNYTYAGGAHGITIIKSLTFDIQTGKSYLLNELFKTGSDYVKILSGIVQNQITERDITLLDNFKGIEPNQDYYIADKSLIIYFQLYEITAYVFGFPHFPISVYEIESIINEQGPLGAMLPSD